VLEFEESIQLSKILKEKGVDLIDVSSGGAVSQQIPLGPNYRCFCRKHKTKGIPVGLITEAAQAEQIIASGK
jgi:2,4-dienoyl-CoA reductase-like NADH-dependent reductase (Old Yellow Enzyme family)